MLYTLTDCVGVEGLLALVQGKNRRATVRCVIAATDKPTTDPTYESTYFQTFNGFIHGELATEPRGEGFTLWMQIFIPDGFGGKTVSQLDKAEFERFNKIIRRYDQLDE